MIHDDANTRATSVYLLPIDTSDPLVGTGPISAATNFAIDTDGSQLIFLVNGILWAGPISVSG